MQALETGIASALVVEAGAMAVAAILALAVRAVCAEPTGLALAASSLAIAHSASTTLTAVAVALALEAVHASETGVTHTCAVGLAGSVSRAGDGRLSAVDGDARAGAHRAVQTGESRRAGADTVVAGTVAGAHGFLCADPSERRVVRGTTLLRAILSEPVGGALACSIDACSETGRLKAVVGAHGLLAFLSGPSTLLVGCHIADATIIDAESMVAAFIRAQHGVAVHALCTPETLRALACASRGVAATLAFAHATIREALFE